MPALDPPPGARTVGPVRTVGLEGDAERLDPSTVPLHTVRVGDPDADDVVVCEVRGEIDVSNVSELHIGLEHAFAHGRAVVVDLSLVHFFASAGIRALFDACADHVPDHPMAVVTGPGVRTILRICGLESVAPCLPDREAALHACRDALTARRG